MNPRATNHPVSWFKKYHDDDALDLSPAFQRKLVWSDSQASYLIDTILTELPVPEIFVRSVTSSDGETTLQVVDGQQRLHSIIRFYSGDLELDGDQMSPEWQGASWDRLTPEQRTRFFEFELVVRELRGASDAEVRDMFRRLNANQSSLNKQELRHSWYQGEFIGFVEDLADDSWWLSNRVVTPLQIRRMLDVEFVSELLVAIMSGPLDKKQQLESFYSEYDDDFPDREHWRDRFLASRRLALNLTGADLKGWRSKTEFYSLFLASSWLLADEMVPEGAEMKAAVSRLRDFRDHVDQAKRRDNEQTFPKYIRDYADAATRASTDLARRVLRSKTITSVVLGETQKV